MSTRARFLRALPTHDFAPAVSDVDGISAEGAKAVPRSAEGQASAFAAEVGAFAAAFWELAPAARRKRWDDLNARAFGPATAWFVELERGLDVTPVPQKDVAAKEVSGLAQELFTLPPRTRAARLHAWLLADHRSDPVWTAAVRTVLLTDLPLARLDTRLFDWFSMNKLPAAVRAELSIAKVPERRIHAETSRRDPEPPAGGRRGWWHWWLILVAASAVARVLTSHGSRSERYTPPPSPPPAYHQPFEKGRTQPPPQFSVMEVRGFRNYERDAVNFPKAGTAPPPGYAEWLAAGRPPAVLTP